MDDLRRRDVTKERLEIGNAQFAQFNASIGEEINQRRMEDWEKAVNGDYEASYTVQPRITSNADTSFLWYQSFY